MDINQFRNKLGAGGARPNQFLVTLTWPALVGAGANDDSLLVTGASLPASNVNPTIIQYRGREVKFAGERVFEPWSITVVNSTDFKLRQYFERWSNLMNDRINNGGSIVPTTYYKDLTVEQLDRNDQVLRTYKILNAFPSNVSDIALQYGQNDVISEFTVTFQYSHFEVTPL
jgi:hypothetical protein